MEHEEYEVMFHAEDRHWWYQGMARITRGILDRLPANGTRRMILDAGCGTGGSTQYLDKYGSVIGVDFAPEALRFSQRRGIGHVARASVAELPFRDDAFDLITSFDVLSECGEGTDKRALAEFARVLKSGGRLLLRLPAYRWLHGRHDELVHTRHRYTKREIRTKLQAAGFEVELSSYANTLLFPLAVVRRMSERFLSRNAGGSDLSIEVGPMNGVLRRLLSIEAPFVRSIGLPFGLTVVTLARNA